METKPETKGKRKLRPIGIAACRWQWIDNTCGPMGWFTPQQKGGHMRSRAYFKDGYWRAIPPEEAEAAARDIGRLAYAQS